MNELTDAEREFILWALGYLAGAAWSVGDGATRREANRIAEKLKVQPLPADTSTTSTEDASAGAQTRRQP